MLCRELQFCALYLSTPNHDYRLSAKCGTEIDRMFLLHKYDKFMCFSNRDVGKVEGITYVGCGLDNK